MTTRDELLHALASARTLQEQVELAAELDSFDQRRTASLAAERSVDWAETAVRQTFTPVRVHEHHTAATDWLAQADLSGGDPHQKIMAEAAVWFNKLHPAVKADAEEFVEQARGMARRTASRHGEAAPSAERSFMEYVAFLNRQVLAASGLDQVQQLVDSFEKPKPTQLPTDVFDNFAPPVHPINEGVTGTEQNSLAPGAQEAMSEGGTPAGRPSEHDEGGEYEGPQHGTAEPRSAALARANQVTASRGHDMHWQQVPGGGWHGSCHGCGSSLSVIASGQVEGTAHQVPCGHRAHGSLGEPTLAIGYKFNLDDFLRAQAGSAERDYKFGEDPSSAPNGSADDAHEEQEAGYSQGTPDFGYTDWLKGKQGSREAGGVAPFVREAERDRLDDREEDTRAKDEDHDEDDEWYPPRTPLDDREEDTRRQGSKKDPDNDRDDDSTDKGDTDDDRESVWFPDKPGKSAVRHTAPGGGEHAPYSIRKVDGGYAVFNDKGERKNEEPKTHTEARQFQKALYANVPGAAEEAKKHEAASSLPQIQQVVDVHDQPAPTSLPTDVMFPIDQPWPEHTSEEYLGQGGQDTGPTNRPRQAARKQADMFGAGDTPHAVPGGSAITGPEDNPPARPGSHVYTKGFSDGQSDANSGQRPAFADNSSGASQYVKGYVEGFNSSVQQGGGAQDVPVSMGGDNGQAVNSGSARTHEEQPLQMGAAHKTADGVSEESMRVSASMLSKDVSGDEDFQRGYRWARQWRDGQQIVGLGSKGEEAGIYAGITDNPAQQTSFLKSHQAMAREFPELVERLRSHEEVTRRFAARNPETLTKGLYVQAGTSTDLDTMSPAASPDPNGSTPMMGPGSVPPLRDAPGTPAAPGGASPYNGAEPMGAPVAPDPVLNGATPAAPSTPDSVNMAGDSSLSGSSPKMVATKLSPQALAFRKRVQQNKLALRRTKEN